jgi:putative aldouronate transport system substrate-binding protein
LKKIIIMFLAVSMLFVLIMGCSKEQEGTPETPEEPSNNQANGEQNNSAPSGPFDPFEETVVLNLIGTDDPTITYVNNEDANNNVITDFYKEKLNIEVNRKWIVDSTKFDERLNLAIASNELPDSFAVNSEQLTRLINAGQIQDISEAYEKYASDNLRKSLEYMDSVGFGPVTVDGKIYGLPLPNDFADHIAMMYIRQDWLDKLDMKAPETLEELEELAKAFMENDPNNTGKNDTIGIAMDKDFGFPMDAIAHTYGAYPRIWLPDDNGELVYGSVQPEMKQTLSKMQEMYSQGIFDSEFAVKDAPKVAETVAAGEVGIFIGPFWAPLWQLQLAKANNPDAEWSAFPIHKNLNGELKPKSASFVYRWQVVSKEFKQPEAIIKAANLWYELWQGEYAEWYHGLNKTEYSEVQEGLKFYAPFWFDVPDKNLKLGYIMRAALEADDPSLITHPEGEKMWDVIKEGSLYGWSQNLITTQSEYVLGEIYDEYQMNAYNGLPSQNMTSKKSTLDTLEEQTFTKIIMGEPIDNFDEFVKKWNQLGGNELTQEVNEWYDANN